MSARLHIIKPSVNSMCARVLIRAATLDLAEVDTYGKTRTPEYLAFAGRLAEEFKLSNGTFVPGGRLHNAALPMWNACTPRTAAGGCSEDLPEWLPELLAITGLFEEERGKTRHGPASRTSIHTLWS